MGQFSDPRPLPTCIPLPRIDDASMPVADTARILSSRSRINGQMLPPSEELVVPREGLVQIVSDLLSGDHLIAGGFAPVPLENAVEQVAAIVKAELEGGKVGVEGYVHHSRIPVHLPELTHAYHGGTVLMHIVRGIGWLDAQQVERFLVQSGDDERGVDFGFFLAESIKDAALYANPSGFSEVLLKAMSPYLTESDRTFLGRGLITSYDLAVLDKVYPAEGPTLQVRSLGEAFARFDRGGRGPWELHLPIAPPELPGFPITPLVVVDPQAAG